MQATSDQTEQGSGLECGSVCTNAWEFQRAQRRQVLNPATIGRNLVTLLDEVGTLHNEALEALQA